MKENTILKYLEIPKDYSSFIEFIDKNSDLILSDPQLMSRILYEMNQRLSDAKNPFELHQDSSMMLATIRFHQEAFLREYKHDLSIQKLVDLANTDAFESYYEMTKSNFLKAKFVDRLDFNFSAKEGGTQRVKKKYDVCEDAVKTPKVLEKIEEECLESQAILNIREEVGKKSKIEYLEMVVDVESYSKTIYNAFNLALAVRNKAVSLVEECGKVYVTNFIGYRGDIEHNVVELTYEMYNKLVEKYKKRSM